MVRRLEAAARAVLPGFGAALLMVMAAGPTGLPTLVAAVTLPQVVFWSIFRPAAMAPPVVFLLGLLLATLHCGGRILWRRQRSCPGQGRGRR
jgi:rod shape-determining protein MreD